MGPIGPAKGTFAWIDGNTPYGSLLLGLGAAGIQPARTPSTMVGYAVRSATAQRCRDLVTRVDLRAALFSEPAPAFARVPLLFSRCARTNHWNCSSAPA